MRIRILAILMVLMSSATAQAECIRHTPLVTLAERVQLARPGEVVSNGVTFRNRDSCECPLDCFQIMGGYRPIFDVFNGLTITATRIDGVEGWVCLGPGEEQSGDLVIEVAAEQSAPGFVTPVVQMVRWDQECQVFNPLLGKYVWGPGCFEREGGALCVDVDYFVCKELVYAVGGSTLDTVSTTLDTKGVTSVESTRLSKPKRCR